jgi:hypothetical protein
MKKLRAAYGADKPLPKTVRARTEPSGRPAGFTAEEVEGAVDKSQIALKKKGLSGGVDESVYGTRLHTELRQTAEQRLGRKLPPGTEFYNDKALAEIAKLSPDEAKLTAAEWLKRNGLPDPGLSQEVLHQPAGIGSMKPDLAVREPGGVMQVIDLTGQPDPHHLAKTIFYALVLGVR